MFNITEYIRSGLKNTLLLRNNTGFSYNGPWKQVYSNTRLDRWHMGDFSSAEYTISADLDSDNKEIIKVLVTATRDTASAVVYARNNTNRDLISVSTTVNDSYVDIILNPATTSPAGLNDGVKVIHTVHYYHNQNPLTP
jgi:hypothetical protein